MKSVKFLLLVCTGVGTFGAALSAAAAEQAVTNPAPKPVAPQAAAEAPRVITIESGNAGLMAFVVPFTRSTSPDTDPPTPVEKWKSVTVECGNGGSLTFLIPAGK